MPAGVAHDGRHHDGEPGAVRAPEPRRERVLDVVARPVLAPADPGHVVVREAGGPHEVRPRLVVVRVGHDLRCLRDDGEHEPLEQPVARLDLARVREVALQRVAQHVRDPAGRLVGGQRLGELGVHDREARQQDPRARLALEQGLVARDDRVGRGLAARGGDGQHDPDGQRLERGDASLVEVPDVAGVADPGRDGLGSVDDAPAADSQTKSTPSARQHSMPS